MRIEEFHGVRRRDVIVWRAVWIALALPFLLLEGLLLYQLVTNGSSMGEWIALFVLGCLSAGLLFKATRRPSRQIGLSVDPLDPVSLLSLFID